MPRVNYTRDYDEGSKEISLRQAKESPWRQMLFASSLTVEEMLVIK